MLRPKDDSPKESDMRDLVYTGGGGIHLPTQDWSSCVLTVKPPPLRSDATQRQHREKQQMPVDDIDITRGSDVIANGKA